MEFYLFSLAGFQVTQNLKWADVGTGGASRPGVRFGLSQTASAMFTSVLLDV